VPAVGVDIGGTKVLAVRLGPKGPEAECRVPTPLDRPGIVDAVTEVVDAVASAPDSVGVGLPGMVDAAGVLRSSAHLAGIAGLRLADALQERWPTAPVWVGNDATAAGWAEHTVGAGRGRGDLLMVTLGTGIGGGIVTGGRLVGGAHGYAGEWGHMVVDPHGPPCPCGQRGCWERFASGSGLGRLGRDEAMAGRAPRLVELAGGDAEAVRGEHVTAAAREGDEAARSIMADLAWWLALGLANLANALDPEVIVLGGGLVDAGELLLAPARRAFAGLVEGGPLREVEILAATLGPLAGAVGAGLLAGSSPAAGSYAVP